MVEAISFLTRRYWYKLRQKRIRRKPARLNVRERKRGDLRVRITDVSMQKKKSDGYTYGFIRKSPRSTGPTMPK
jgi:hypothetical protein